MPASVRRRLKMDLARVKHIIFEIMLQNDWLVEILKVTSQKPKGRKILMESLQ